MKLADNPKDFIKKMKKLELFIIENVVAEEKLFIYGTKFFAKVDKSVNPMIDEMVKSGDLIKTKAVDTFYHYEYRLPTIN